MGDGYQLASFIGNNGNPFRNIGGQSIQDLKARIAALEDCLQELAPFAACMRVDMQAHFQGENEAAAQFKGWSFKRDTLYIDQRIFRKIEKLLRIKL